GTSSGHIIKLIDDGASLSRPASGAWATDFTSATVATLSSPLSSDGTNLYFGGTDNTTATRIFGVQISATTMSSSEKALAKNIGSVGAVTTAPTWGVYNGSTYVFVGSAAISAQAYIYRAEVAPGGVVNASYNGPTTNVNGGVNFMNDKVYAVTEGGALYVLDANNFTMGGFTVRSGFPYQNSPPSPIRAYPFVDGRADIAYFGDNSGKLHVVTGTGSALSGYPYSVGSLQLTSVPCYLRSSGTIAIGASDGYVYFINRHTDVAGHPAIRKRYFIGTGTVSTVSYNGNSAQYMMATSDGHLAYISAADVGTDADGFE
ncbi:MAG: hypothetical protein JWM82_3390, partial [Myxococcales bacterium]|nr:hypothetical protein [Myxococcales bacterium]